MTKIKNNLVVLLLGFFLAVQMAGAVTNVVLPGESIQAQINLSGDGDTVAIFGGTYSEDLVITQSVRLAEVIGQEVTINGSLLISGVTNAPPLEGFAIGSTGRGVTISNTPGILLNSLDLRGGTGLAAKGSSEVRVQNCLISSVIANSISIELTGSSVIGDINQSTGHLYVVGCGIGGSINASNASSTSMVFRCVITNDARLQGSFAGMAYTTVRSFYSSASGSVQRLVGCRFNPNQEQIDAVTIDAPNSNLQVVNCEVTSAIKSSQPYNGYYGIHIGSVSSQGILLNNYIRGNAKGTGSYPESSGIRCAGSGIKSINNLVKTKNHGIRAPFGSVVYGNYVYDCNVRYEGGVVPSEDFNLDPKYDVNLHALLPDSPCIDGGTTDSQYRDRDGSRADAGPTGGAWFDPSGWTSDVPVVVSFDLSTDQYLEGTLAEIMLSGGHAVSVP